jgi:hypothetical protein
LPGELFLFLGTDIAIKKTFTRNTHTHTRSTTRRERENPISTEELSAAAAAPSESVKNFSPQLNSGLRGNSTMKTKKNGIHTHPTDYIHSLTTLPLPILLQLFHSSTTTTRDFVLHENLKN